MCAPPPPPPPPRARGCRHWVGLTIVAIQMAAWCLVGALLIHRGISNLQRRDGVLPAAPPAPGDTTPFRTLTDGEGTSQTNGSSSEEQGAGGEEVVYPEPTASPKQRQWSFFPQSSPVRPFVSRNSLDVEVRMKERVGGEPDDLLAPGKGVNTGAATAVVMVTVGGVMLVVGPAFLLLKVIDVYQRQSRRNKLSRQEDPPPSYEEVAEKAPRYSALFQVLDSGELVPLAGSGASSSALPMTASPDEDEKAPNSV